MGIDNPELGPPQVNSLTFESFWEKHQEDVHQKLDSILKTWMFDRKAKMTLGSPAEASAETLKAMAVQEMLDKEKTFALRVYDTVHQAVEENGKAIALFDVDFTLAETDDDEYRVRPICPKLFSEVLDPLKQEGKLDIGLITTKSVEKTLGYLQHPNQLGSIAGQVNPDLVYSSLGLMRDEIKKKYSHGIPLEALEEKYCQAEGPIDSRCLENCQAEIFFNDDYEKPALLQEVKQENPDTAIVAVDDVIYPQLLNREKGFYGVPVQDCKFTIANYL
ncbi:TPA: hypothetical protein DD449_03030 [Candidatus Berkelbacteria bacterium]|uniref:Uncharacterized protein n=1 Tax=Berkelbacteria bacterium GW2011_GWE1_39_12 TaxID=1618337 RepID=A0A0G4B2A3_9BACT|nr:MAG: hypothetical protein UT28_C0001G0163 [Berkelbacteria bacterium GW2011_GWE1_39_12]HBO60632.1 hypothetical protein [Candidatus Berkelbacteria bacterium]